MLKLSQVSSGYDDLKVLFDISLTVNEGETVAIVGSNGAGKSTILRTISGLLKTTGGTIEFCGEQIQNTPGHSIAQKGIAHVPEGRQLFNKLSVKENLLLGAHSKKYSREGLEERLNFVFDLFPRLRERLSQNAGTLSGGEQQMLAIGRGLMMNPKLIMLDEPSLGIAPKLVTEIFMAIEKINKQGTTALLVEQNVIESLELASRAYILQSGQITMEGAGRELLKSDMVRASFLGF